MTDDGMSRYFPDRHPDVLATLIREVRFKPVRFVTGYDMGQVDDLLDRLVDALSAGEPVRPLVAAAGFDTTRMREGYSQPDVDAFLAEVARRAEA
jgi:DivIVA domain-containing protein